MTERSFETPETSGEKPTEGSKLYKDMQIIAAPAVRTMAADLARNEVKASATLRGLEALDPHAEVAFHERIRYALSAIREAEHWLEEAKDLIGPVPEAGRPPRQAGHPPFLSLVPDPPQS